MEEIVWPAYRNHLANAYDLARRSSIIVFVNGNTQGFSSESEVKMVNFGFFFYCHFIAAVKVFI